VPHSISAHGCIIEDFSGRKILNLSDSIHIEQQGNGCIVVGGFLSGMLSNQN
jgi:hypothetical protein